MFQPKTCSCTPVGKESSDIGTNTLIVSVSFDPGCSTCASCTCIPTRMGLYEDDKWKVYVSQNGSCPFCYLDPPDLLLFRTQQDIQIEDEPCPFCGTAESTCDCLLDCFVENHSGSEADIKQGKRYRLRGLGRRFMSKLRALRKDNGGGGGGGGIRHGLSQRLGAVRRGKT